MGDQAFCKSCGKPIKWIEMKSGKFMPVEMQEVVIRIQQGGRFKFVLNNGVVVSGEYARPHSPGAFNAYVPHWGNCPGSDEHRRSNGEK